MVGGHTLVSIQINSLWMAVHPEMMEVNKATAMNMAVCNNTPSSCLILLDLEVDINKLKTPQMCYIPHCLLPTLLAGACSPREV